MGRRGLCGIAASRGSSLAALGLRRTVSKHAPSETCVASGRAVREGLGGVQSFSDGLWSCGFGEGEKQHEVHVHPGSVDQGESCPRLGFGTCAAS